MMFTMRPVVKMVTPEMAEELLTLARPGNKMIRTKVEKYKKMMLSGKWRSGLGSPIIIKNGQLLDGRHRLTAIIETGVTIKLPFKYG